MGTQKTETLTTNENKSNETEPKGNLLFNMKK
jgi:hypothetical protein